VAYFLNNAWEFDYDLFYVPPCVADEPLDKVGIVAYFSNLACLLSFVPFMMF
jgi:hypothetical protein